MHQPEFVHKNETQKILRDSKIQTDYLIPVRRRSRGFCHSGRPQSRNKRKQKDGQILGPCQRTKKAVKYVGDGNSSCSWCTWKGSKMLGKVTGIIGNHPDCWDRVEYWEESWKPDETYCHPDSSERLLVKTSAKNLLGVQ